MNSFKYYVSQRRVFPKALLLFIIIFCCSSCCDGQQQRKILCLHGGGQTASSFENTRGMQSLIAALPEIEFVFPTGSYDGPLWIPDPPNGKGEPTTDPDIASLSVNALEAVVANQGPFYGILGYSQGGAFVTTFLSQTSSATFEVALIFCGYLPTTHLGLVSRIDAAAPFENIRALVFMGTNDNIIPNDLSRDAAAKYSSATLVYDAVGHEVPWEATTSFQTVTAFITSPGQSDAADSVTSPGQKSSDHRFFGFACALCLFAYIFTTHV